MCVLVALLCALQSGKCFYCGVEFTGETRASKAKRQNSQWSRDHVLPLSKGGRLYILACLGCNHAKGCRLPTPEEMRRATILRADVDRLGIALQGEGWSTLKAEKAVVHEQIESARRKRPVYRCPKLERPSTVIAEALMELA